jgi:hypothetical protein
VTSDESQRVMLERIVRRESRRLALHLIQVGSLCVGAYDRRGTPAGTLLLVMACAVMLVWHWWGR